MKRLRSVLIIALFVVQISRAQEKAPEATQPQADSAKIVEASKLNQQVLDLYNRNKIDEALPLARRALQLWEQALGPEHEQVGIALRNLGSLYLMKGRYSEAALLLQRALGILERAYGQDDARLTSLMETLGWARYGDNDVAKAEALFKRVLAIRERQTGQGDEDIERSLTSLGRFYLKSGNYGKALDHLQRGLAMREKRLGPEHKDLVDLLDYCACALWQRDRSKQASELYKRARAISKRESGDSKGAEPQLSSALAVTATYRQEPVYPSAARQARLSGTVIVEVLVNEQGSVLTAKVICGADIFAQTSLEAAELWRFAPTLVKGTPVSVVGTITFNYRM